MRLLGALLLLQVLQLGEPFLTADDVAVMRAAIAATIAREAAHLTPTTTVLVSRTLTTCDKMSDAAARGECGRIPAAFEFRRAAPIPPLDIPGIDQVAASDVAPIFALAPGAFWPEVEKRFAGAHALAQITAPEYANRNVAALFVSMACDAACSKGWLVRLTRQGGQWVSIERQVLWTR